MLASYYLGLLISCSILKEKKDIFHFHVGGMMLMDRILVCLVHNIEKWLVECYLQKRILDRGPFPVPSSPLTSQAAHNTGHKKRVGL